MQVPLIIGPQGFEYFYGFVGGMTQQFTPNLFENIGMLNQRTLLINRPTMGGPGKVVLKSSQAVLNVLRVRLDWAWERIGFDRGIQGNLDPVRTVAGWEVTRTGMREVLASARGRPGPRRGANGWPE